MSITVIMSRSLLGVELNAFIFSRLMSPGQFTFG